jgi:hypothetical protein
MDYNDKNHWQLYTSKGYLWMNGKNILEKVHTAMDEIGAEVYDIKYMDNESYLNYLRVKFDRIFKMPSAVK